MNIRSGLIILLLSALPFSHINATPTNIAENCQQWENTRAQQSEQATLYWLQGFVAAYNEYEYRGKHPDGVFKTSDSAVIATWLDEYCQTNPQSNPQEAVESLIEEKKPPQKACTVRKSGGRPCIPAKEKDENKKELEGSEKELESNEKKNKWLPW